MAKKILLFLFVITAKGQTLHHQMLASQGANSMLQSGVLVHQSIGQQSPTGTYGTATLRVEQGYQQSKSIGSDKVMVNLVTITAFPVPFVDTVTFQFSSEITAPVSLIFYDVLGRIVYTKTPPIATSNTLKVDQLSLADGEYFVIITYQNIEYSIKLLRSK
jgi:hypothetical protein